MDNLGRVRVAYSGIRISPGGVTKTQNPKTQTSDPENLDPSNLFKLVVIKDYESAFDAV